MKFAPLAILVVSVLAGCVTNPADLDVKTDLSATLYGSKFEGSLLKPKAAMVSVSSIDAEPLVVQLDATRPRYVAPGRHTIKLSISIGRLTASPTFEFVAEPRRSYRFSAVEVKGDIELIAQDVSGDSTATVFKARVTPDYASTMTYINSPPWH